MLCIFSYNPAENCTFSAGFPAFSIRCPGHRRLPMQEPVIVLLIKEFDVVSAYGTDVTDPAAAGLSAGCPLYAPDPINPVAAPVLPGNPQRKKPAVAGENCRDIYIYFERVLCHSPERAQISAHRSSLPFCDMIPILYRTYVLFSSIKTKILRSEADVYRSPSARLMK